VHRSFGRLGAYKFESVLISTAFQCSHLECKWCNHFYQFWFCWVISSPVYHEALLKTQRYGGMTDDESLAMITINPARQLENLWICRINWRRGKQGDLVHFWYTPLSFIQSLQMTSWMAWNYFLISKKIRISALDNKSYRMVEDCFTSDRPKLSGACRIRKHLLRGGTYSIKINHPKKTKDIEKTNKKPFSPSWSR